MDPVGQVGRPAPYFDLAGLDGHSYRLEQARGRVLVLVFWSADCPHAHRLDQALGGADFARLEEVWIWRIASNANETLPMLQQAAEEHSVAPVLIDPGNRIADAYQAQVTPQVYVIDREGILRYAGAPDDVAFRQRVPTRHYLAEAVAAVLQGEAPDPAVTPAFGCTLMRQPPEGGTASS